MLSILAMAIAMFSIDSSKINSVYTQGNTIGQEGDGNEASQSESSPQETNQNSLCVSGESTSSSCNNLSSENIDTGVQGEEGLPGPEGPQGPQGEPGPQSIEGKVYGVEGNEVTGNSETITSIANCDTGDTVMGGGYEATTYTSQNIATSHIKAGPTPDLDGWEVTADAEFTTTIRATAVCFDNP